MPVVGVVLIDAWDVGEEFGGVKIKAVDLEGLWCGFWKSPGAVVLGEDLQGVVYAGGKKGGVEAGEVEVRADEDEEDVGFETGVVSGL